MRPSAGRSQRKSGLKSGLKSGPRSRRRSKPRRKPRRRPKSGSKSRLRGAPAQRVRRWRTARRREHAASPVTDAASHATLRSPIPPNKTSSRRSFAHCIRLRRRLLPRRGRKRVISPQQRSKTPGRGAKRAARSASSSCVAAWYDAQAPVSPSCRLPDTAPRPARTKPVRGVPGERRCGPRPRTERAPCMHCPPGCSAPGACGKIAADTHRGGLSDTAASPHLRALLCAPMRSTRDGR